MHEHEPTPSELVHAAEAPTVPAVAAPRYADSQELAAYRAGLIATARRERARQNLAGLVAAFGRFAFTRSKPRTPRHADTWRDKGPHESRGAAARRRRQMERQRGGVTLAPAIDAGDIPY